MARTSRSDESGGRAGVSRIESSGASQGGGGGGAVSSVDGRVGTVTLGDRYVNVTGDAMTGPLAITTTGQPALRLSHPGDGVAAFGPEQLANNTFASDLSGWTAGTGWTWNAGTAKHAPGSTAVLSQDLTLVAGETYRVSWTITGRTAGSVAFALGANATYGVTSTNSFSALTAPSASTTFTITPSADFDGAIDVTTLALVSPTVSILATDGADSSAGELRMIGTNVGLGYQAAAGGFLATANNAAVGHQALRRNGNGFNNTAIGALALTAMASGSRNTAIGTSALKSTGWASDNTAIGYLALSTLTTGTNNTALGNCAGHSVTNPLTTGNGNVFLGPGTGLGSPTQRDYAVAIGADAKVDGNLAVAIGRGAVAGAAGAVAIGVDSSNGPATTTTANEIKLGTANHTTSIPGALRLAGDVGFYGGAPVARPTGTPAAATDAASAQVLVNFLRSALLSLNLIASSP